MVTKEELEHLKKDETGRTKIYCQTPTIFHHLGIKEQKKRYGRKWTKQEAREYERQFKHTVPCSCGNLMYSEIKDMNITDKRTGKKEYFPSEQFWVCDHCNIKMLDCGSSSLVVRTMLNAGVNVEDAIGVFDD